MTSMNPRRLQLDLDDSDMGRFFEGAAFFLADVLAEQVTLALPDESLCPAIAAAFAALRAGIAQ